MTEPPRHRNEAQRKPGQTMAEALGIVPEPGAGRPLAGITPGAFDRATGAAQYAAEAEYQGFGDVDGYNDWSAKQ